MILRSTLLEVLGDQRLPVRPSPEIDRELASALPIKSSQAVVLKGVRRCGKSNLQAQLMRRTERAFYCNLEDTRLFGLTPEDFPAVMSVMNELVPHPASVFLDEVQVVPEWERLVRTLLDQGCHVCVTGSNASLLGKELGARLTGRHLSFEVFPFSFREYLALAGADPSEASLLAYLDEGGFPGYLRERSPQMLRELLRDVVERDIAMRHGLRETRHVMNLVLFLLANTGQPFSMQRLTKSLAIPGVGQTSQYLEHLQDAYLLFAAPKFSSSFKQRVISPNKYYANDTGFRRINSPQNTPDRGHRLENLIFLALRRAGENVCYAGERDRWECDFVTDTAALQVCAGLTPENRRREIVGLTQACRLPGKREALILTLNQRDELKEDGVWVKVLPAWEWLLQDRGGQQPSAGA